MKRTTALFGCLSLLFMIEFAHSLLPGFAGYALGMTLGLLVTAGLVASSRLFSTSLRTWCAAGLGLILGSLMGLALLLVLSTLFALVRLPLEAQQFLRTLSFLFSIYLGTTLCLRTAEKLFPSKEKKLLLDLSALHDPRLLELARSGLLDGRCLLPRFLISEIEDRDLIKKLEALPHLEMRYEETDFPTIADSSEKVYKLASRLNSTVLCVQNDADADPHVRTLNLNTLSNALKPLKNQGELLEIKIQRLGKEDGQGVGYLENGSMVVVNGGGPFLGQAVHARVLSVKNSGAGRMLFCNIHEETIHAS